MISSTAVTAWCGFYAKVKKPENSYTVMPVGAIVLFLLIPIAEEMVFRGFLQGWLLRLAFFKQARFGITGANLLTSFAFALAHLWQHPAWLFPSYSAVSLVLGYFRERYGGVLVPILLHGYYNLGLWVFAG